MQVASGVGATRQRRGAIMSAHRTSKTIITIGIIAGILAAGRMSLAQNLTVAGKIRSGNLTLTNTSTASAAGNACNNSPGATVNSVTGTFHGNNQPVLIYFN